MSSASHFLPCRYCGGVRTTRYRKDDTSGMCSNCSNRFYGHFRKKTPLNLAEWLAGTLRREAARVAAGRVIGRCEAINTYGWQCGSDATTMRGERRVCPHHKTAPEVTWATEQPLSSEARLAALVASVATDNAAFKQATIAALQPNEQPSP